MLFAALLGWLVSRTALRPVRQFTESTEAVSGEPVGRRLDRVERDDELGRLARSFNTTLEALESSVESQRQLVADASHELRTPDRQPAHQHPGARARQTACPPTSASG